MEFIREAKRYTREHSKVVACAQTAPFTIVKLELKVGSQVYSTYGEAKCSDKDTFDMKRGYDIALGRAVAGIARELAKDCARETRTRQMIEALDCTFKTVFVGRRSIGNEYSMPRVYRLPGESEGA